MLVKGGPDERDTRDNKEVLACVVCTADNLLSQSDDQSQLQPGGGRSTQQQSMLLQTTSNIWCSYRIYSEQIYSNISRIVNLLVRGPHYSQQIRPI